MPIATAEAPAAAFIAVIDAVVAAESAMLAPVPAAFPILLIVVIISS
jgi:hypothetical protein